MRDIIVQFNEGIKSDAESNFLASHGTHVLDTAKWASIAIRGN